MRDLRQLDAVHGAGQIDVGQKRGQAAADMVEHKGRGFAALALDHVHLAFSEQCHDALALKRVVFDDQCDLLVGLRLRHKKSPLLK